MNIPFSKETFVYLLQKWYISTGRVMQAVHPRDILRVVTAICDYDGQEPRLTPQLIDDACNSYFVET